MKKFFTALEHQEFTMASWFASVLGIVFIRAILENFFNGTISGYPTSDAITLVHFFLWYLAVVVCLIFCIKLFVNKPLLSLAGPGLFGLLFIWIAPVVDLLFGIRSHLMSYIYSSGPELCKSYLSFFHNKGSMGITPGIRIEIIIILAVIGCYIYINQDNLGSRIIKTALGVWTAYTVIFAWLAFPGLISLMNNQMDSLNFFISSATNSIVYFSNASPDIVPALVTIMSQIVYTALFLLAGIWLVIDKRSHLIELLKNSRWPRLIYFLLVFALGLSVAGADLRIQHNWTYYLYLLTALLAIYCFWMFSVGTNDLVDLDIDRVSNSNRPLVAGTVSTPDLKNYNFIFLIFALVGGFLLGQLIFYFIAAALFSYFIYSMPPLRLKRIFLLNNFLVAMASLSIFLAGFYSVSLTKTITAFPINYFLIIPIVTLIANFKDIKDIEGDRLAGIRTVPVILGKWGKHVVGLMALAGFCLIPALIGTNKLFWTSIPAGLIVYYLVIRKRYKESYIFLLFLIFFISSLILAV